MVSGKLRPGVKFVLVLTGDGLWERRVLSGLAPKFDGRILLWFPPPLGKTGLENLHEAVKVHLEEAYKSRTDIRGRLIYVLVLIDKEHFERPERALEELKRSLVGIEVLHSDVIEGTEGAFKLECKYGHRPFLAFVSVQGIKRCLNEQIASLLRQSYGIEVEADYGPIMRALRRMGKDLEEIVAERSLKELEKVLPSLVAALRVLKRSLAEGKQEDRGDGGQGRGEREGPRCPHEIPYEARYRPRGEAS